MPGGGGVGGCRHATPPPPMGGQHLLQTPYQAVARQTSSLPTMLINWLGCQSKHSICHCFQFYVLSNFNQYDKDHYQLISCTVKVDISSWNMCCEVIIKCKVALWAAFVAQKSEWLSYLPFVFTEFVQVSNIHKWFKILHIIVKTHCLSHKNANQAQKLMLLSACN